MRIVIVDESSARAAIIKEGLAEFGAEFGDVDVTVITERHGMAKAIAEAQPDMVFIDLGNPSRDMLEEYFAVTRALQRPIAMFVDESDQDAIAESVDAGVSAYIVDGLKESRVKPIMDLAIKRFQAFSALQRDLQEARTALADRKIVDEAKRILMAKRGLNEPEAHSLLRKHAMNSNRRMAEVAEAIVTAEKLMGEAP